MISPVLNILHCTSKISTCLTRLDSAAAFVCVSTITGSQPKGLQWVIDVTIAYPKAKPMDIQTWIFGYRPPTVTHVHYR